jgi:hypothetical protein
MPALWAGLEGGGGDRTDRQATNPGAEVNGQASKYIRPFGMLDDKRQHNYGWSRDSSKWAFRS